MQSRLPGVLYKVVKFFYFLSYYLQICNFAILFDLALFYFYMYTCA